MNRLVRITFGVLLLNAAIGCASVRPYEKEHLADPIMTQSQEEALRELKWLEAREGSTGGAGGAGGGCACK
ncbi:MAG: DUF4266 domain-containing protein [Candidatus Krumholzibacteria bacterium]|nr:DUF4266 domain-containing protein [Candidatus Krumholzibacteria bacterium]MDH4337229.1 DUF4266 domain-containing protein [Candidatus Krumholzibacteria bacterium]MDH5268691.1 DUF4266 domain-containing protein [Candidatus Krumholzibacteria bacterium]